MNDIISSHEDLDIIFMGVKSEIRPGKIIDTKFKAHGMLKDPYYIYKIITPYNYTQIINRKLFEDIKYPEGYFYEDVGTLYKIINKCKRAYIISLLLEFFGV